MSGRPPCWILPPSPAVDLATREGRVRALGQLAQDLLAGREPPRQAIVFLAGAIAAWLANGGSLERDYLQVAAQAGSHRTPASLWASSGGQHGDDDPDTVVSTSNSTEPKS